MPLFNAGCVKKLIEQIFKWFEFSKIKHIELVDGRTEEQFRNSNVLGF